MIGESGTYDTSAFTPRSLLYRIIRHPSLAFYAAFLKIIMECSWKASREKFPRDEWVKSSVAILHALEKVGIRFHVTGLAHPAQVNQPVVFIGNHMSMLETMILPCLIEPRRTCTFVVKKELTTYPVFGPILRSIDPIAVSRISPKEDFVTVMQEGEKRLRDQISVIIFPQTTRLSSFYSDDFNSLGIKLAARANVPVIALALKTDAWANGKWIKDFGRLDPSKNVHFSFSEPMHISARGNEQHRRVVEFISQHVSTWMNE